MHFGKILLSLTLPVFMLFGTAYSQSQTTGREASGNANELAGELQNKTDGTINITSDENTGSVSSMLVTEGSIKQPYDGQFTSDPQQAAELFLAQFGIHFGSSELLQDAPAIQASAIQGPNARPGSKKQSIKFKQKKNGFPVFGSGIVVRLNEKAETTGVHARLSTAVNTLPSAELSRGQAELIALEITAKENPYASSKNLFVDNSELTIYNPYLLGAGRNKEYLAWQFEVRANDSPVRQMVFVDAVTGRLLLSFDKITDAMSRTVHDQMNDDTLSTPSGTVVRAEGDPATSDADVDKAYTYTGDFYNFFDTIHGRDSIDDAGYPLTMGVRYCKQGESCPYANALWDGNISLFGQGLVLDDAVAHEWAHGFTEFTSNLIYLNQSGAINESLSDMWGEFVDLSYTSGPAGDDSAAVRWLIGEDHPVFFLRSMKNPAFLGHPDKTSSPNYYCGPLDDGGVHSNSGVNNKAVTLLVDGGTFNGQSVSAIGMTKTAKIYYEAQTNILMQTSTYSDLFNAVEDACDALVGIDGITLADCGEVNKALLAVEMNQANACVNPPPPLLCEANLTNNDVFFDDFEANDFTTVWQEVDLVGTLGSWLVETDNPYSASSHLRGDNPASITDSYVVLQNKILVPTGGLMSFEHLPAIEKAWDGGVVEISSDDGTTWVDVGPYIASNSYNEYVGLASDSPLVGRDVYGAGGIYRRTIIDLSFVENQEVLLRFRIGTSSSVGTEGWDIDDVRIYSCGVPDNDPVAVDDNILVDVGGTQTVLSDASNSVIDNDTDDDLPADTLTVALDQDVTNGALALNADGTFSYTHNGSATSSDSFTYILSDANGGQTDTGVVTITIASPQLTSHTNNQQLATATETFVWDANGLNVTKWWLNIGTAPNGNQVYKSSAAEASTYLSQTITTIPTDGSSLYLTLWYQIGSQGWKSVEYVFTTSGTAPTLTPANGASLIAGSETFTWIDNGAATATEWQLFAGSTQGGSEYFSSLILGDVNSAVVSGLPLDGGMVYVRLWHRVTNGPWLFVDAQYTAATNTGLPAIFTPTDQSTLTGTSQLFEFQDNGLGSTEWWLNIGAKLGGAQYYTSQSTTVMSHNVTTLPNDGSTVFARLYYRAGSQAWQFVDSSYTASGTLATIDLPLQGIPLTGASEAFSWTEYNTPVVAQWWLYAGSSEGASDYFNSGNLGINTSVLATGLPTNSETVYVRLWYKITGESFWKFIDVSYTASSN